MYIHIRTKIIWLLENERDSEREREPDVLALVAVQATEDRMLSQLFRSLGVYQYKGIWANI